jgi:hypothetical protein
MFRPLLAFIRRQSQHYKRDILHVRCTYVIFYLKGISTNKNQDRLKYCGVLTQTVAKQRLRKHISIEKLRRERCYATQK